MINYRKLAIKLKFEQLKREIQELKDNKERAIYEAHEQRIGN